ncbi:INO80 complex subunit B-like [Ptychodera flava]|uniref:INO80 complex subunit B-like n=1 Tax=Ptychodera flava TaxID=63121 RepID=UPI00396A65D3
MAKTRDGSEESRKVSSHKKHKKDKHKHKKKKKREHHHHLVFSSQTSDTGTSDTAGKPQLKLKIKIGGKTFGTKNVDRITIPDPSSEEDEPFEPWQDESPPPEVAEAEPERQPQPESQPEPVKKKDKKNGDDTDEEAWLNALESGKLDDDSDWRKKDPSLLTARQRAMLHGPNQEEELLQLPSGYKQQEMTEEMLQRKAQKAKKRRQQAQKKIEENKKNTIERLLKKQETKARGGKKSQKTLDLPKVTYINRLRGSSISLPQGMAFPLQRKILVEPSKRRQICGVTGCNNTKKYCCSKTGTPLCSLECYKKNLVSVAM